MKGRLFHNGLLRLCHVTISIESSCFHNYGYFILFYCKIENFCLYGIELCQFNWNIKSTLLTNAQELSLILAHFFL